MPARNVIRYYSSNSYYHIYNRGVEKRNIFLDQSDYKMFLYYLFVYLAPPELIQMTYPELKAALKKGNLYLKTTLHSYVLMPNHFHFLLHQTKEDNVTTFMRRITNAYTKYFNDKYNRVGGLFQGVFKAVLVETDEYLLQVSRYIHKNPIILSGFNHNLEKYIWSSYRIYLGLQRSAYINTECILSYLSEKNPFLSYKSFVEEQDSILPEELYLDMESR